MCIRDSFTAKLFDLSSKEAAEKLAQDFGLIYDSQAPPRRRYVRQKTEAQKFREDRQRCYRVLSDYYYLLKKWEADSSPRTPEEEPHPRFVEAIQKKTYVEYLLDLFLDVYKRPVSGCSVVPVSWTVGRKRL